MAVFTRVKTWVSNEVLTASDLNGEFNNLLDNTIPASIEDYSTDVSQMQSTADPGTVGTESLATTLAGEIQRLRFRLKQLAGTPQWYGTPISTFGTGGIVTSSYADASITNVKMADNAITTSKIVDGSVTQAKRDALNFQLSSSSGSFNNATTSYVDVTNLTVTITTTGRPVWVGLVHDAGVSVGGLSVSCSTADCNMTIKLVRGSTDLSQQILRNAVGSAASLTIASPLGAIWYTESIAAGTYVYKVQIKAGTSCSANVLFAKLMAYEL